MLRIWDRIYKELEDLKIDEKSGERSIHVISLGNDIMHWKGKILGPVSLILLSIERHSIRGWYIYNRHSYSSCVSL